MAKLFTLNENGVKLYKTFNFVEQAELGTYALLASPTFTGTPIAPTATAGTNNTQIATTAFVANAVASGGGDAASLTEVVKYTDNDYTYFSGYKTVGWQVNRWDINTSKTIATGTGTKPASLAECQAQSYS